MLSSAIFKVKSFCLRNIQLQRAFKKNDLTAIHVIKRSIDLQLWIMAGIKPNSQQQTSSDKNSHVT